MPIFAPKFLSRIPIAQLQTLARKYIVESEDPEIEQGDLLAVTAATRPKKLSAEERLENLSSLRINPRSISYTRSGLGGTGGKAEVEQATFRRRIWNRKRNVAVKKLKFHQCMDRHKFSNAFAHEVQLMAGLSHQNIVQLIGFVEDIENGQAWLIMSWEPNGNVSEFLASGNRDLFERIGLIQDTFEGLKYLHTRQPPICHGDLKSLNILVSSSHRAIITDFGSARALKEATDSGGSEGSNLKTVNDPTPEGDSCRIQVTATGNQLTLTGPAWSLRWASPEVVNGDPPSLPSDMWSVAWVCWEIMTEKLPFSELDSGTAITLRVVHGEVPVAVEEKQLSQIFGLCNLMARCWAMDPGERPSVTFCCDEFGGEQPTLDLEGVSSGSRARAGRLLFKTGHMYCSEARYENAAALFEKLATQAEDEGSQAEALYWLGYTSAAQSKYIEAEVFYIQAHRIYVRLDNQGGQANAFYRLGIVYLNQVEYAEAEISFLRAEQIYGRIGHKVDQANALKMLGNLYRRQSNFNKAAPCYSKAREIAGINVRNIRRE